MTDKEELSRGDALAKVAVLEDELVELRGRVCVPEGYVVVPVEPTIDMSAAARRESHVFITFGEAEQVYRSMIAAAPACSGQTYPLYITHRPLIHNAINLLGMRRPVAPDVELVINGLRAMLDGMPTPAEPAAEHWIAVAQSAAPAPVERVEQAACTGKNCGSIDPNLHSADCFAEHERAITPNAARKAPPEDPLCGIEYRADGEANFYTLSAETGSWIARIQFNGQFYPHEQERILSAMLGDRNVRYGDGYYDGYWSARKESAAAQDVAGLPFVRKILEKLERFRECAEDDEGVDIGRNWLDMLTHLGLLNRVQRSPARWEMTTQADDALEAAHQSGGAK